MKKRAIIWLLIPILLLSILFSQQVTGAVVSKIPKLKSYKLTVYHPVQKTYFNVSGINFTQTYKVPENKYYSTKIVEFYNEPNHQHVIVGDGWIAEENFK